MKLKVFGPLFILLLLFSCKGEQKELVFFEKTFGHYQRFINDKNMPVNPNLRQDIVIFDDDYPLELALYRDGKFFYNLPNLGVGEGAWSYEKGSLVLKAKRKIFHKMRDMVYHFSVTKDDSSEGVLKFRDRFGANTSSASFRGI